MTSNLASEVNGVEDEDAALRRAIAMSLGQDVSDDEPASPSRTNGLGNSQTQVTTSAPTDDNTSALQQPATSSMAALGLDRKKMEEERLARLRKRKADDALPDRSNTDGEIERERATRRRTGLDLNPKPESSSQDASAGLKYPKGAVLKTWARGVPREGDIKIEEVFQKDDLQLAVLSSFQWDEDWLMSKLNLRQTKVLLIAYAKDEEQKNEMRQNTPPETIRFVFPPMDGIASAGCMHSKLQLLKYPKSLRIVVPTGNLVPYDWGETGSMENMVFLIDLPRIEDPVERKKHTLTHFGQEMCFFLGAKGVDDKMLESLRNYDFSETARYGFVHTIAGSHPQPDLWQRTGYCGLGRTVKALRLESAGAIELDYICSSIGAVNRDLLAALYNACQGDTGLKEYTSRAGRAAKGKAKGTAAAASRADLLDLTKIRVYFPSRETVDRCRGGRQSAGTIRFQSRWWNAASFPRAVLRDCKNVRSGILMHSKVIYVQRPAASLVRGAAQGWAYVGSHNLSESAWGRLVKDRGTGEPKLNARNWECGVLVPTQETTSSSSSGTAQEAEKLEMFRGAVPVPVELPAQPYHGNDRQPWFAEEA
ncbi:hypothetical protein M406DRAFT_33689 [Cryphonectria parasitica EP155]|uniref:PLD phosphodiesterase domain-containing protein n=1 Tax=Cryphonectria parasitica (strain ATCC 38755 / EP155) TaxID=660469 RepID=A0A9P4YC21_CRYP1|nr:uncharacterized protein M406DRAFT_33689 [Cryphonectria parasitica EP155]KAF3770305.1 hypothetical protein M406DRAFT_33689 [Cryphonectria parasitica EP155]